jgi:hypothetical protein
MIRRYLVVSFLLLLVKPSAAADWRAITQESRATPPPIEFLDSIKALRSLGYQPRPEHKAGWFAWTPCDCSTFMLCWGLERSYRSQLRADRHEHDLWAWVYDSDAHALLGQENYEWLGKAHHYRIVLERHGKVLVVLEGPGGGPSIEKLREHMGHRLPGKAPMSWVPGRARPSASQPVRQEVTKATLLDPSVEDSRLPSLMNAYPGPDVERVLNQRGMAFYRKREYSRAAIAFELAIGDSIFATPIYHLACIAALQGDALRAMVWLWRVLRAPGLYGTDGTHDSPDLLRRSRKDRDFAKVRTSPEYRAFEKCLPP